MSLQQRITTDPIYIPKEQYNAFDRFFLRLIKDPRDLPFMYLCLQITLIIIPFAIALFVPGVFRWWLALIYLFVTLNLFLDRFILMLHNTSHRSLFKRKYKFFNHYVPWVIGPFFGETPETYYAHHIGMHHPENNMPEDLSSTMQYQRDSFFDFVRYHLRFFFGILFELTVYMRERGRFKLIRRMLWGEVGFYVVVAGLLFVNWQAAVTVFVIPFCFTRLMMMAGNWGQHAFLDHDTPENCYRNSITCINCRYNRRAFNDGYHISHHLKPNRHWTDHPLEFEENIATYAKEGAIVFEGIDFFMVWFFLMFKNYNKLAKHYVQLDPENPLSREEIIALLKERTRRFEEAELKEAMASAA